MLITALMSDNLGHVIISSFIGCCIIKYMTMMIIWYQMRDFVT